MHLLPSLKVAVFVGKPSAGCTRTCLSQQLQMLQQEHGLELMVGIECELYLLKAHQEGDLLQYHAPHTPRSPLTGKS